MRTLRTGSARRQAKLSGAGNSTVPETEPAGAADGAAAFRKAVLVLDLVASAEEPPRLAEVMAGTGLPRSTAHRLLAALSEEGLLRADLTRTGGYGLGPRLLTLARRAWDGFDIRTAAAVELARLRDLTGLTAILAVPSEQGAVYVEALPGASGARLQGGVGTIAPLHATALGKAILSGAPAQLLAGRLARLTLAPRTARTIGDVRVLAGEVELARSRFYALEDEENEPGIRAIAAPVYDSLGGVAGAIGIAGPAFRLSLDQLHELGPEVIEAAKRSSQTASGYPLVADADDNPFGGRSDALCLLPLHAFASEGAVWSRTDGRLYWVDVVGPGLHVLDPATGGHAVFPLPTLVGAVAPRASGGLLLGLQTGLTHFDTATGRLTALPSHGLPRPGERIRSMAADPRGRLWITTMDVGARPGAGRLLRLGPDGGPPVEVLQDLNIPNSPAWSLDGGTLYLADASGQQVYAFDFDPERGTLSRRRTFGAPAPGRARPAGLAVDSEGGLWVAHRDGWCVTRYAPDGEVERVVALPVPRPSGCTFGGPDLSRLFITTARIRLSHRRLEEAPLSGSLMAYDTGVRGLVASPCRL